MTKNELIDAYVRGDVDRRGFIRKLTAMGVSATAAAAYATSFAHDAAAAPMRNGAGFVARAQIDDDYGIAVIIEDLLEAITAFLQLIADILNTLDQLLGLDSASGLAGARGFQGADPTQHPDWQYLSTIRDQIAEQQDAIVAELGPEYGVTAATGSTSQGSSATTDQLVATLAEQLNTQAGVAAAIIPNLANAPAGLQLMTNIGIVNGRHAAVASSIAGMNPSPSAFETPIDPSTL